MTTLMTAPPSAAPSGFAAAVTAPVEELAALLSAAADSVARFDVHDDRWSVVGPALTAVVDAVRRAIGGTGSPIRPGDDVVPVLRLRDLARTGERVAGRSGDRAPATAVAEVAGHVGFLVTLAGH